MAYFTLEQLTALVPQTYRTDGLDDDADAVADAFDAVRSAVENRVNGMLGARYSVPVAAGNAGVDAFLSDVCCLIAAAMIYTRRGIRAEEWPFKGDHSSAMARLRAIAKGEEPLSPAAAPVEDATIILSEDARSYSGSLSA